MNNEEDPDVYAHPNKINRGEMRYHSRLGVWRAKDLTGKIDAFKNKEDAEKHTKKDPFAGLSRGMVKAGQSRTDRLAFGNKQGTVRSGYTKIKEDAPTNSAGGGQVAAIGVGPHGEPPKKTKGSKLTRRIKPFTEFRG